MMPGNNERATECLNRLVITLTLSVNGFRRAAEQVQQPDIKSLLQHGGEERRHFISELQTMVARLDGSPESGQTTDTKRQRGWVEAESESSIADDYDLVSQCERGEERTCNVYDEALNQNPPLPSEARLLVTRQREHIQETIAHLRKISTAAVREA